VQESISFEEFPWRVIFASVHNRNADCDSREQSPDPGNKSSDTVQSVETGLDPNALQR
jgi:hypothetical protein